MATIGPNGQITPTVGGGSPVLRSGERNQKWPTSRPSGYINPAFEGVPDASEQGTESELAHKWA